MAELLQLPVFGANHSNTKTRCVSIARGCRLRAINKVIELRVGWLVVLGLTAL